MITAASKVKPYRPLVPTTAPTVTLEKEEVLGVSGASSRHVTAVSDDHLAVLHTTSVSGTTVGVNPNEPKLEPKIVSVPRADAAILKDIVELATGAVPAQKPLRHPM